MTNSDLRSFKEHLGDEFLAENPKYNNKKDTVIVTFAADAKGESIGHIIRVIGAESETRYKETFIW